MSSFNCGEWNSYGSVKFFLPNLSISRNCEVIFYDLDGTLVTSRSGTENDKITCPDDFIFYPSVIQTLSSQNDKVIVIYNSYTLNDTENHKERVLLKRANNIRKFLEDYSIHPFIFISTKRDKFKVPELGIYTLFESLLSSHYSSKIHKKCIVGDSIGGKDPNIIYRNGNSDSLFSENIAHYSCGECKIYRPFEIFDFDFDFIPVQNEVIILMGNPSCGKSTLAENISTDFDYAVVKKVDQIKKAMKNKSGVIVDNRHPSRNERKKIINWCRFNGHSVRIIFILVDGRNYNSSRDNDEKEERNAFENYSKRFEMPYDHPEYDDCEVIVIV